MRLRRRDPIGELAEQIYFFALDAHRRRRRERPQVVVAEDVSEREVVDLLGALFEADEGDVLRALGRLQAEGLLVKGEG